MLDKELMEYYNTEITHIIRESVQTLRINFDKMVSDSTQTIYTALPFGESLPKIPVIDHYVYIAEILYQFEVNIAQYIDQIYHSIYDVDSEN